MEGAEVDMRIQWPFFPQMLHEGGNLQPGDWQSPRTLTDGPLSFPRLEGNL